MEGFDIIVESKYQNTAPVMLKTNGREDVELLPLPYFCLSPPSVRPLDKLNPRKGQCVLYVAKRPWALRLHRSGLNSTTLPACGLG